MAKKRGMAKEVQLPAPLSARSPELPEGYDAFLRYLKERIRAAQRKAAVAVNLLHFGVFRRKHHRLSLRRPRSRPLGRTVW